jgi:hypothetical protein
MDVKVSGIEFVDILDEFEKWKKFVAIEWRERPFSRDSEVSKRPPLAAIAMTGHGMNSNNVSSLA